MKITRVAVRFSLVVLAMFVFACGPSHVVDVGRYGHETRIPKAPPPPAPKDTDGDGVMDDADKCPAVQGLAPTGCPLDSDGDGIADNLDACPEEAGITSSDGSKNGCPKLVRVTDKEIVILEQVQFDFAKATIRPESHELLDAVAKVLVEHPEIVKVEVQGHTDDVGAHDVNMQLSSDRAGAVKDALEGRGIDSSRLVAKGYGPDRPIARNDTDDGRQKNRRVQFIVLERRARTKVTASTPTTPASSTPTTTPTDDNKKTLVRVAEWEKTLPAGSKRATVKSEARWVLVCEALPGLHDGSDPNDASNACLLATPDGSVQLADAGGLSDAKDIDGDGMADVIVSIYSEHVSWSGFEVFADRTSGPVELEIENMIGQLGRGVSSAYWTDYKSKNALGVLWMPGGMEMGPDGEAMPVPSRSYVLVWNGAKLVEAGP